MWQQKSPVTTVVLCKFVHWSSLETFRSIVVFRAVRLFLFYTGRCNFFSGISRKTWWWMSLRKDTKKLWRYSQNAHGYVKLVKPKAAFFFRRSEIIGSAEALPILCVRYFRWEREREIQTDRERRKWRHHCRAKIGDEFTLSLAKNSHNWRWAYTFPCQKFALFVSPFTLPVSPFTERSPLWRWNSQWVHTFHCQKFFRPLCSPSFKWHEPRDGWSKTQDKWSNPAQSYFVLPIEKMNQINTKNYWK